MQNMQPLEEYEITPLRDRELEEELNRQQEKNLIPNGDYEFLVDQCINKRSKAQPPKVGYPQMRVLLKVVSDGGKRSNIETYLNFQPKPTLQTCDGDDFEFDKKMKSYLYCNKNIKDFYYSIGKQDEYNSGKLNSSQIMNSSGRLTLGFRESEAYGKQNTIKAFLPRDLESEIEDDDISF